MATAVGILARHWYFLMSRRQTHVVYLQHIVAAPQRSRYAKLEEMFVHCEEYGLFRTCDTARSIETRFSYHIRHTRPKPPWTVMELKSILGVIQWIPIDRSRLGRNVCRPKSKLKNGLPEQFSQLSTVGTDTWATLKKHYEAALVPALRHGESFLTLDNDAWNTKIDFALIQDNLNRAKTPLGYWSKMLN